MCLKFHPPLIKDAQVVVCPPVEVVEAGASKWADCVVGYFLDKQLPFSAVESIAKRIWRKFGIQQVLSNDKGFFFFKFSQDGAHRRVIEAGPWHFGGKLMVLKQWSSQMKLEKDEFDTVPLWAQFYNVPLELWNEEGLSYIASAIGNPLYADSMTESGQRLSFARICVEVVVGSDFPNSVCVEYANGKNVVIGVKYPWKPLRCLECHLFGHSEAQCGRRPIPPPPQQQRTEWVVKGGGSSLDVGGSVLSPQFVSSTIPVGVIGDSRPGKGMMHGSPVDSSARFVIGVSGYGCDPSCVGEQQLEMAPTSDILVSPVLVQPHILAHPNSFSALSPVDDLPLGVLDEDGVGPASL